VFDLSKHTITQYHICRSSVDLNFHFLCSWVDNLVDLWRICWLSSKVKFFRFKTIVHHRISRWVENGLWNGRYKKSYSMEGKTFKWKRDEKRKASSHYWSSLYPESEILSFAHIKISQPPNSIFQLYSLISFQRNVNGLVFSATIMWHLQLSQKQQLQICCVGTSTWNIWAI